MNILIPYILIIFMRSGGVASIQFGSQEACENAKQLSISAWNAEHNRYSPETPIMICVER